MSTDSSNKDSYTGKHAAKGFPVSTSSSEAELAEQKQLESEYVMRTFSRKNVEFVKGHGMRLEDSSGKEYLDFLSGIGVCSLGHTPKVVVDALMDQAEKLIHVSNYFYIQNRGEVAKLLSDLLNHGVASDNKSSWKSFFANSGAEANECAIKLARIYAKNANTEESHAEGERSLVITLVKSFHGRTLATLAATGQSNLQRGFEPIPEGFLPTPINDCEALEQLFERFGKSICAVMLEPIQGESGVNICSEEFVKAVRRLTEEYGALMICDEVQSGVFRTGKPFAFQHYGVIPDVVTIAKGIAGGMPCAACAARGEIGNTLSPGQHGSTFGGSNMAMAASRATLTELSKPQVAKNIEETGEYLLQKLSSLDGVSRARGKGLMAAVDLAESISAPDVVDEALELGLVINATGPLTLRFLPPLICSKGDVDEFAQKLQEAISVVRERRRN